MDIILSESEFENCLNYSLSSVVNRLAGLGCSSSCAGHDIEFLGHDTQNVAYVNHAG